jgi:hypothetical protein
MKEKKVRQLAAVMFADIVGYTALMQKDEQMASSLGHDTGRYLSSNTNSIKEKSYNIMEMGY